MSRSIDKKKAVLEVLTAASGDMSVMDLVRELGESFSERSVRRWLSEFVEEGVVKKIGQKRGTRYVLASKVVLSEEVDVIAQAVDYVKKPLFDRDPVGYNDAWLAAYEPNKTKLIPSNELDALEQMGKREEEGALAGMYARKVYDRFLTDLSYYSSRLEGNTYSLLETERLIVEGVTASSKLDMEKVMILNHKEVIQYLVDEARSLKICETTISTVHYLLSDSLVSAENSGKVRRTAVRIGGSTYIPIENPMRLAENLKRICQKASQIESVHEQSFFLLVHLSYLQAFIDVNKRTARLSANIPLIQKNYVPLSFQDIEKEEYAAAFIAIYELNDVAPLRALYLRSYARTCASYDRMVDIVGFDAVRVRYRDLRRKILRHIILKQLISNALEDYVLKEAQKTVPEFEQADFIRTVREDVVQMDLTRIVGLGVTVKELNNWLQLRLK